MESVVTQQFIELPLSAQRRTSLLNRLAQAKKNADAAKAELDRLKNEAAVLLGEGTFKTSAYEVRIGYTQGSRLDTAKVKALLTPAQLISATVQTESLRFTFKGL